MTRNIIVSHMSVVFKGIKRHQDFRVAIWVKIDITEISIEICSKCLITAFGKSNTYENRLGKQEKCHKSNTNRAFVPFLYNHF